MNNRKRFYYSVLGLALVAGGLVLWRGMRAPQREMPVTDTEVARPGRDESRLPEPAIRPEPEPLPSVSESPPVQADRPASPVDTPPGGDAPQVRKLLEEGMAGVDWPPGADRDGNPLQPSPADDMVRQLVREIKTGSGPEAYAHALQLLAADQEGVGLIGAALLAEQPDWAWDAELLRKLAAHADVAVPLLALQSLIDAGRTDQADVLRALLAERLRTGGDWTTLPQQGVLPGTALRALIALSRDIDNDEARMALTSTVLTTETADYGARMAALLELREILPFEEFRAVVRSEVDRTDANEPDVWRMGLERLHERLEGPVEVHVGTPVLTVSDVQVMTAREYPTRYEDLALHLEGLARDTDSLFGHGVIDELGERIQTARRYPLSDSEAAALRRIEALLPGIEESDVAGIAPPPPPSF